jgi:uncharacterized protein (TIGR02145 family)
MIKMLNIKSFLLLAIFITLVSCEKDNKELLLDGDGNEYGSVPIGTQVWLSENLKTTKYVGGGQISLIIENKKWEECKVAAYCWYDNNIVYKSIYGGLYNYHTVKIGVLCPVGYHVPTKEEWMTLIDYLGGEAIAGDKLKELGSAHWGSYNYGGGGATNESGFTALPGGIRYWYGGFGAIHGYGYWWTAEGEMIGLDSGSSQVIFPSYGGNAAISLRCLKDK